MTFEIEAAGEVHVVTVEPESGVDPTGGRFRITIRPGGPLAATSDRAETVTVDARRTDLGLSLLHADARSVDAAVTHAPGGRVLVQLPHVDVWTTVDGRRRNRGHGGASETGEQRVTAPMPGRILRVLVAVGDEVGAGQAVAVIEAMKMENDLKVVRAGRVREVLVAEATSVEAGRLLLVVE